MGDKMEHSIEYRVNEIITEIFAKSGEMAPEHDCIES